MRTEAHEIVVLGAGYTGMMAAMGLARRTRRLRTHVTLINPSSRFVERLRLHQIAAGQELANHQIPDIIAGTGVAFIEGQVTAIDADSGQVLINGDTLRYDTLVYAVGSDTDTSQIPGVEEHAHTVNGIEAARAFATSLAGARTVTVCGGGLTGIEAATEVAESHPQLRVTLLSSGHPGAMMGPKAQAYLGRGLQRLGVVVWSGVQIAKVLPGEVELADGRSVPSDTVLWTCGVRVAPLAREAGVTTDGHGRVVTDGALRSVSHPQIFAIGDAAAIQQSYGVIHGTCQSGIPTGAFAAEEIARQLAGKPRKAFRFGYIHQPVSIGRRDAVIQFTFADDTPRRWYLAGRAAILYKHLVSSSPIQFYRLARRLKIPARTLASTGGRRNRIHLDRAT
jgi:NADH:ubiquinone reductase (H+-translocating)